MDSTRGRGLRLFTFWDMLIVFIAGMPIGIAASHYGWIPGL